MSDNPTVNIEKTVALREAEMAERKQGHSRLVYDKATRTINPVDDNPAPTDTMTADQQIRAKALECALVALGQVPVAARANTPQEEIEAIFENSRDKFERYIREGK